MTKVLVVDDEPAISDAVSFALTKEGFEVRCERDGESGLAAALSDDFDVVVLDLLLPGLSGREVCRRLRSESTVPIVMLTARDSEVDRVVGLELGADDYVTKPFSMAELVSRVRAILRRRDLDRSAGGASVRQVGGLSIDLVQHQVLREGGPVQLTPSEFRLLRFLAEQPGRVFSRREIMQHLWDSAYVGDERTCDVHVSNLRQKVERDPSRPERLLTVRGFGYKLVAT